MSAEHAVPFCCLFKNTVLGLKTQQLKAPTVLGEDLSWFSAAHNLKLHFQGIRCPLWPLCALYA